MSTVQIPLFDFKADLLDEERCNELNLFIQERIRYLYEQLSEQPQSKEYSDLLRAYLALKQMATFKGTL